MYLHLASTTLASTCHHSHPTTDAKLNRRLSLLFSSHNVPTVLSSRLCYKLTIENVLFFVLVHELHPHSVTVHHFSVRLQVPPVVHHPLAAITNRRTMDTVTLMTWKVKMTKLSRA